MCSYMLNVYRCTSFIVLDKILKDYLSYHKLIISHLS